MMRHGIGVVEPLGLAFLLGSWTMKALAWYANEVLAGMELGGFGG